MRDRASDPGIPWQVECFICLAKASDATGFSFAEYAAAEEEEAEAEAEAEAQASADGNELHSFLSHPTRLWACFLPVRLKDAC